MQSRFPCWTCIGLLSLLIPAVSLADVDPILAVAMDARSSQASSRPSGEYFQPWNCLASHSDTRDQSVSGTFSVPRGAPEKAVTVTLSSVDLAFDSNGRGTKIEDGSYLKCSGHEGSSINGNHVVGVVYQSTVVAMPGQSGRHAGSSISPVLASGTNHRMILQFTGLRPNQRYLFTFYAYDDASRQGVYVFTNVTDDPCRYLNSANTAENGNLLSLLPTAVTPFAPGAGDHNDGTQYAPDGQYVWTNGKPATALSQYALPIEALADQNGKVVFAETTVTNLYGEYQPFPVLNGFELALFPNAESTGSKIVSKNR